MPLSQVLNVANMFLNAIRENKILAKVYELQYVYCANAAAYGAQSVVW